MLQIKHISKEYHTGDLVQKALDDVSLNLRDNEFVAILGPSGSGKTTLLNIIGGLDRYDSGDLIINGVSTSRYNDRNWDTYRNHSIGFVFQSYNLIPHQTVLSNVELALTIAGLSAKERKERAKQTLEKVGLGDQIHKKPNQMSGGQMQRVALARALVNDPDILLADEPTGALDSETSRQVMDLIKQVAQDRLVVMVTHNPELAEEYATRIVRLKDGNITDDTMPFTDEEIAAAAAEGGTIAAAVPAALPKETENGSGQSAEPASDEPDLSGKGRKKHASMSFLTSLALSFSNLRTKKGRTILTSFAGSIGIIGIALILSLSNGVNDYIAKIQKDTMASYPITVNSTSWDFSSLMMMGSDNTSADSETEGLEPGKVNADFRTIELGSSVTSGIKENNLTDFKKYLDDPNSEIQKWIGEHGIVYTYDVDYKVYTHDPQGKLLDTDEDVTKEFNDENNVLGNLLEARSLMLSNMSTMFGGNAVQQASNFSEMMAGAGGEPVSQIVKDNYDLVYGSWPEKYDEVILKLNRNGTLSVADLYQLGMITKEQLRSAIKKVEAGEKPDPITFDYSEICKQEFNLLTNSDGYKKNKNGTFSYIANDEEELEKALENGLVLRIVGIIQEKEDADIANLETTVVYTTMLTDYMIRHGLESEIVQEQQKTPGKDVLTGQPFMEEEPSDAVKAAKAEDYLKNLSEKEKGEMFTSLMMVDYEGAIKALMTTQMKTISDQIGSRMKQVLSEAVAGIIQNSVSQLMTQLQSQLESAVSSAIQQTAQQMMGQVFPQLMEKVMPRVMEAVMKEVGQQLMENVLPQVMETVMSQIMEQAIPQLLEQFYQKAIRENVKMVMEALNEQLSGKLPAELEPFLTVSSWDEFIKLIEETDFENIDYSEIDLSQVDLSGLEFQTFDLSDLDFSSLTFDGLDFSKIDLSKLDPGSIDLSSLDLSDLDFSDLNISGLDLSALDFSNLNLGSMDLSAMDFSGLDLSGLSSAFDGVSLSMGEGNMAEIVDYWMNEIANQKKLVMVFDRFIGLSDLDSNLKKFGLVSYDAPSSISLYADSFEAKDGIAESIRHYNDQVDKDNQIVYTDYVALLTSSITTIIDAISYVLIGFVGVSLFVSCIMIGVITNISVLERTKEIGVLRALGASKRNISNVFNAETFIIGCLSGVIGVGISLLLTIPINAVVHALMDSTVLSAKLPPLSAGVLIAISIAITMIGGLIPASKASNRDPVEALRSE